MYRIVDTIHLRPSWTHRYPRLAAQGAGCLVILDPRDIAFLPALHGQPVTLHQADGAAQVLRVNDVEINPDNMVALFFRDMLPEAFAPGSFFTWE